MRKFIALFLALIMALSFCACSGSENNTGGSKVKIVATIFPQYDFARQIAGDLADITMLLAPGEEIHTYDPSPADIITIQSADIFIYGGGESDTWLEGVFDSIDTSGMTLISLMDVCELLETAEEHDHDHEHEHEEMPYDEHVWTSPANAKKIVEAIANALCTADPDDAAQFRTNRDNYLDKLTALDLKFHEVIDSASRSTLIFGDRFPLLYFAEEYGLDYCAAFPGCASNAEPSAATVAELIETVKRDNIPIVFKIELSNGQIADSIAEASGARVETFYSCQSISKDDFENGETYLSLMEKNIPLVKEALH
ncbi:MAG: zinc ABC transporter substrate-binding protein [Oscillospiraceae bacterium]|nr:zinc ABC transporter substrate-binding protein [Oscillospiraceae bacterium]